MVRAGRGLGCRVVFAGHARTFLLLQAIVQSLKARSKGQSLHYGRGRVFVDERSQLSTALRYCRYLLLSAGRCGPQAKLPHPRLGFAGKALIPMALIKNL